MTSRFQEERGHASIEVKAPQGVAENLMNYAIRLT